MREEETITKFNEQLILRGDVHEIRALIDAGLDVNQCEQYWKSFSFNMFLKCYDLVTTNTLLYFAIIHNSRAEIIDLLLENGALFKGTELERYSYCCEENVSRIITALEYNHLELAEKFIKSTRDVDVNIFIEFYLKTNNLLELERLFKIDSLKDNKFSKAHLLKRTLSDKKFEMSKHLIRKGFLNKLDISFESRLNSLIWPELVKGAIITCNLDVFNVVFENIGEVLKRYYEYNRGESFSLNFVIRYGNLEIFKKLIEIDWISNSPANDLVLLMECAIMYKKHDILQDILNRGVDLNRQNSQGMTIVQFAESNRSFRKAAELIKSEILARERFSDIRKFWISTVVRFGNSIEQAGSISVCDKIHDENATIASNSLVGGGHSIKDNAAPVGGFLGAGAGAGAGFLGIEVAGVAASLGSKDQEMVTISSEREQVLVTAAGTLLTLTAKVLEGKIEDYDTDRRPRKSL